jgi:alpha-L-fucosidase
MVHYEAGGACPEDNTLPALQSELLNKDSGDDWFWDTRVPEAKLVSTKEIIDTLKYLEPKWCTFILNCPPNRDGRLDSNIVERLEEVGNAWVPDTRGLPLPKQAEFIEKPILPDSVWATSGIAKNAIDGINDRYYYSVWQSDSSLPQSITIDMGRIYKGISILNYVPKYRVKATPVNEGSIESYIIYASTDNKIFVKIASGKWDGNTNMKVVTFPHVTARYIKLTALSAVNGYAAATEFEIGTKDYK